MQRMFLDTYYCDVDGAPAIITVDTTLASRAPVLGVQFLSWVSIDLCTSDGKGFPSHEEKITLDAIESELITLLASTAAGIFCGTCTTAGQHDYLFYLASPEGWEEKAQQAFTLYPHYTPRYDSHLETRWETYRNFLYPSFEDTISLCAAKAKKQLFLQGADDTKSARMCHFFTFPSPEDSRAFCQEALPEGFSVHPHADIALLATHDSKAYHVCLTREEPLEQLESTLFLISNLAGAHGGWYEHTMPFSRAM